MIVVIDPGTGFSILTRDYKKVTQMSPTTLMASAGFMADAVTLKKTLAARCTTYEFQNEKPMGCVSFAQMLSNTLYYRRFFPVRRSGLTLSNSR